MRHCVWKCVVAILASVLLSVFLHEQLCDNGSELFGHKNTVVRQMVREQLNSEVKNHLEAFKEMQKTSPGLQHASYKLLAGAPPQEKKLLTVGISSIEHPHGSHLLDTLHSLFQATSDPELAHIIVLVHLSEPDPQRLYRAAANISGPFAPHLESRRLLVVSGLLGDAPLPGPLPPSQSSPCEALRSRQREGHALLMNFASELSEYFLLLEDNTQCTPRFVSAIYWTLVAWRELHWVVLEFSSLGSGQVLRSSDLPRFTSFCLLFPEDAPTHLLLSKFRLLLAQTVPIRFGVSLFHHMGNRSQLEDACFPVEEDRVFGEADNPAAVVHTDMLSLVHIGPQYAYVLNEEYYFTLDPVEGNHLTVILDSPQRVNRVAVLTGTSEQGLYRLHQGQVLLGSEPIGDSGGCARYTLLGPLVGGNLDQRVFYEEGAVEQLSCIQLLVLESQESWLLIKQIKVWTEYEEEEES
nr:alpha-1,6-mannosyl-glycoprotein 4-beta-N-acetylglucosaminyltransferase isoform X2 [Oryctolagus cuniculus]